jgi:xanthine dehydrogenase iron-sulfur cluster and FAD-binding subunit A
MGSRPGLEICTEAQQALAEDISPIDDIRSDRNYRMSIARNLLSQFLRTADAGFARA